MGRVPGYLGNTNYWFGAFTSSRRRRRERKRQQMQAQAPAAKQSAQQNLLRQQQAQKRLASKRPASPTRKTPTPTPPRPKPVTPPKPTAAPVITPKAAPPPTNLTPQQEEAMLMQQLTSMDAGAASMAEPMPMSEGSGGGDYTPSSGGKPSMTPEEMEEARAEEAEKVAQELAIKYPGRPITKAAIAAEVATRLPQAPVIAGPARQGFFGKVLDALFGPPAV